MTPSRCTAGAGRALPALAVALLLCAPVLRATDTLPDRLDDEAFRALVDRASEADGPFQSDNLTSNEDFHQDVIPAVRQIVEAGGVYVGVGPEQNFTYMAAFRPKMAFIVDIRRQNTVLHLYYKALFELAPDRASFLARLFSRPRPAGLPESATVTELFDAVTASPVDIDASARNLRDVFDLLAARQWFGLSAGDRAFIEQVHAVFREFGPATNYNSRPGRGGAAGRLVPSYADLMTAVAPDGQPWSYLASEAHYRVVRDLQQRNLIVPLTGDFGGGTTLREVAAYVEHHRAAVHVFYASNVEQYLFQGADTRGNENGGAAAFYANVAALPRHPSSVLIRSSNAGGRGGGAAAGRGFVGAAGRSSDIASIAETLRAFADGRIATYNDVFTIPAPAPR